MDKKSFYFWDEESKTSVAGNADDNLSNALFSLLDSGDVTVGKNLQISFNTRFKDSYLFVKKAEIKHSENEIGITGLSKEKSEAFQAFEKINLQNLTQHSAGQAIFSINR